MEVPTPEKLVLASGTDVTWCQVARHQEGRWEVYWWRASSGHVQWNPLGRGEAGAVVDVSVNMQRKLQQSMPIDKEGASDSVHRQSSRYPCHATETGGHSTNCAENGRFHSAVLGRLLTRPLFFNDRCMVQSVLKLVKFRSCRT